MHILIIEDDMDLGFALQQALKAENISSQWLRRLADAPRHFDGEAFDCVLLDIALPDGTGLELLARWRRAGVTLPVIMITARSALEDRLAGLDGGADDFIVKPFATAELVSRIRAVLRRYAQQASEVWQAGELQIEPRRYQARIGAVPLDLSPREFHLMLELAREPGKVVPKGALAQRLEPLGDAVDFGAIEVHVSNLRRKIGAERIRTVRGLARIDSGRPGKAQTLDIAQAGTRRTGPGGARRDGARDRIVAGVAGRAAAGAGGACLPVHPAELPEQCAALCTAGRAGCGGAAARR
jgi:DNA-binding response OmpR family regulator